MMNKSEVRKANKEAYNNFVNKHGRAPRALSEQEFNVQDSLGPQEWDLDVIIEHMLATAPRED